MRIDPPCGRGSGDFEEVQEAAATARIKLSVARE
jgi:hypothetical protein